MMHFSIDIFVPCRDTDLPTYPNPATLLPRQGLGSESWLERPGQLKEFSPRIQRPSNLFCTFVQRFAHKHVQDRFSSIVSCRISWGKSFQLLWKSTCSIRVQSCVQSFRARLGPTRSSLQVRWW